jgi:hypothetical protein
MINTGIGGIRKHHIPRTPDINLDLETLDIKGAGDSLGLLMVSVGKRS